MNAVLDPRALAAGLTELWSPRVIGEINDAYVKVAKVHGDLEAHRHEHEDAQRGKLPNPVAMEGT